MSQGRNDDVIKGKVMMALTLIKGMEFEDRDAWYEDLDVLPWQERGVIRSSCQILIQFLRPRLAGLYKQLPVKRHIFR